MFGGRRGARPPVLANSHTERTYSRRVSYQSSLSPNCTWRDEVDVLVIDPLRPEGMGVVVAPPVLVFGA